MATVLASGVAVVGTRWPHLIGGRHVRVLVGQRP